MESVNKEGTGKHGEMDLKNSAIIMKIKMTQHVTNWTLFHVKLIEIELPLRY
jgi:hypothetical protein